MSLSPDQQRAFDAALRWFNTKTPLFAIGGLAGTGKTTVTGVLGKELARRQAKVAYVAFTGQASLVLKASLERNGVAPAFVGTLHSLLYRPAYDTKTGRYLGHRAKTTLPYDLVVVDEASMLPDHMLTELTQFSVPILLVGDHGQLSPVMGKGVMDKPDVTLEKIHRQAENNPILKLAHAARQGADEFQLSKMALSLDVPVKYSSRDFQEILAFTDYPSAMFITYRNEMRRQFNFLARQFKGREGPVTAGDKIVVISNTKVPCPLANGSRGIVLSSVKVDHWDLCQVQFDSFSAKVPLLSCQFNRKKFEQFSEITALGGPDLSDPDCRPPGIKDDLRLWDRGGVLADFGSALTCHKAQGSQAERVVVDLDRSYQERSRWVYTAVTRAVKDLWLTLP